MHIIKDNAENNNTFQEVVEWCQLVGIDEVIGDIAFNHLAEKAPEKPSLTPVSVVQNTETPHETHDNSIDFDSCESLEDLQEFVKNHNEYKTLSKTASHMLFGEGSKNAKIMVIADQPGREEDISNTLFSSKKGALIRSIIAETGINSDDIYFTYLSKWRPPGGRKLSEGEQKNCANLLKKQLNIIMPQTVVTLGEMTLYALLPRTGFNFRKSVGKLHFIEDDAFGAKIAFYPLFHEESLLKTPQLKKATWLSIVNCKGDLIRR